MQNINEYIKSYKYPNNINNPSIEDLIEYNNLQETELTYWDIKMLEGLLWHNKRGPKYEIIQENIIYESIMHSYNHEKLLEKINKKFKDDIYDVSEVPTNNDKTKSIGLYIKNENLQYNEEFKSLLNLYNYYVSFCEYRKENNGYWEMYIEPYKPKEVTNYIYNDCKGIIYRFVNDYGLKRLNHHGLVPRNDNDRHYPKYIFVVSNPNNDKLKEILLQVKREIKKNDLHLIKIDLNKYENKLKFFIDPASVNYEAYVTREYIPKYCCEEINLEDIK